MKQILALCAAVLVAATVWIYRATRLPDKFGEFVGAPRVEVAELIARPKAHLRKDVAVEGVVRDQCTTMGCYFFFHEGDRMLRVDLAAIAMNAPRRNGRRVRVEGRLVPFDGGYQLAASAVEFQ